VLGGDAQCPIGAYGSKARSLGLND
jgi:hypothetical protein